MRYRPHQLVPGSFDVKAVVSAVPDVFKVRGMFFHRALKILGAELEALKPNLREPTSQYVPFLNYPQADHAYLAFMAAFRESPDQGSWEAIRRYSRVDVTDFAESMLGRVMMSMVGDPIKALGLLPSVYDKVAPGPWGFTATAHERSITLRMEIVTGPWSYMLGQIEGVLAFYNATAEVEVEPHGEGVSFHVLIDE
ncbi:MAG: DUF2378 family protein [Myxococcota bacterium]